MGYLRGTFARVVCDTYRAVDRLPDIWLGNMANQNEKKLQVKKVEGRKRRKKRNAKKREVSQIIDNSDRCAKVKFMIGSIQFDFNPIVTLFSALIIWAFVVWCISKPQGSLREITKWKTWITKTWTWFYIGTQDVWAVFILILYFSKYSKIKLGRNDEEPEYSDPSYFMMLFSAGMGIGLFFFGVSEPIFHYQPGSYGNRYWNR